MNKQDIVDSILGSRSQKPVVEKTAAFAPTNIALCKYWGKRDEELNLPFNSSLSISLGELGAYTTLKLAKTEDEFYLNDQPLAPTSEFALRMKRYLDLFRPANTFFNVATVMNIPVAAGLASSACGFAALIKTLNQFYGWNLSNQALSILARLGSGSACRSLWEGFVLWQRGELENGMDSFAMLLPEKWLTLRIGLLVINDGPKPISSREAMQQTVKTSSLYQDWIKLTKQNLHDLMIAIHQQQFITFGTISESNCMAMHAIMQNTVPPINYSLPQTLAAREKIWELREEGLPVFFTQDAGPNLKLLFLAEQQNTLKLHFPTLKIIAPFSG